MTLVVHHLQVSQSERIVWLCEELGIEYTLKLHQRDPLFSPQSIKDLNVLGQAPVIQDGSLTLAESGACADYILQKYGHGKLVLGPSHKNFGDYLYWFHFANGNLQPKVSQILMLNFVNVSAEHSYASRIHKQLDTFLAVMDSHLKDKEYLAGEFTAADVMTVFTLTTMRTFAAYDISKFSNVLTYLKRVTSRDGYKSYRAKGDPDLELMIDGPPPTKYVDKMRALGKI